jgi:hypothetical protein
MELMKYVLKKEIIIWERKRMLSGNSDSKLAFRKVLDEVQMFQIKEVV